MMIKTFDEYSHHDFCEKIFCLSMEPYKLVEDFVDHFLHLCYKIPKNFVNFEFLREEFKCLVHSSQYYEPPDFPSSPTLYNHEAPQIGEEDHNTPFFPYPPPFPVPMSLPRGDCKAQKFEQNVL